MARKLSRRALVRGAVGSAIVAAAAPLSMAQETKPDGDPGLDRRLDDAEKKLAHPLAADVKKLTREALKNFEKELADRLKTKLPENSEPCFTYIPTGVKR
ncbi:MAG TPA: hypothetical protein VHE55_18805 [Fimbriimonadaceae bacterium]|nr:hypothetical protein [Fimbriimonadaceae bacterium]